MLSFANLRNANPAAQILLFWTVAFSAYQLTASNLQAQDLIESPDPVASLVTKKIIHEPVHRVPKVASKVDVFPVNSNPPMGQVSDPAENAPVESDPAENVPAENVPDQKVEDVRSATPALLPSATKLVPVPLAENPEAPSKIPGTPAQPASSAKPVPHPLDDALETARRGLENIQENIRDYSAILVKRERVNGRLLKPEYMQVKFRSERMSETGTQIPFSIYMKFIKPRANAGREVIWIKNHNDDKLCVHEGSGLMSLKRINIAPDSWLAMQGQRYPIRKAGMENLVATLIEKAERDRAAGDCEVLYRDGVRVNGRECDVIEVKHAEQRAPYDFHIAKVYIDKELKLPIRYQAHIWPEPGSTKPRLLEEYTYLNVKINQGFTDLDFSPDNPAYNYPRR